MAHGHHRRHTHHHQHHHHHDEDIQTNDPTLFYQPPSDKQLLSNRRISYISLAVFAFITLIVVVCIFTSVFIYAYVRPYISNISDEKYRSLRHTVFLLSIDGCRYDYIKTYGDKVPTLKKLKENGLYIEKLKPVFPTTLYPNQWTALTGKYPENHGILGNTMYDRRNNSVFSQATTDASWWNAAEPIWVTGRKFNFSSALQYIPGSNVIKSTYYEDSYKDDNDYTARIERLLDHLDHDLKEDSNKESPLASNDPISWREKIMTSLFGVSSEPVTPAKNQTKVPEVRFYASYFSAIDIEGHNYGPTHEAIGTVMSTFDNALKYLLEELERREINPLEDINVVVMSTHGTTSLDHACHVHISELLLPEERDSFKFNNMGGYVDATAREGVSDFYIDAIYEKLQITESQFNYTVYSKANVPERFHVRNAANKFPDRAPDLWILMDLHCSMSVSFYESNNGDHGYDSKYSDMSGLLIASGPRVVSMEHAVPELDVVNVYPLLASMLDMKDHSLLPHIDGSFEAVADYIVSEEQSH